MGQFYHSLGSSPQIVDVKWHALGANASTLCVLTAEAVMREYDVTEDVEEPSQTLHFAPASPSAPSSSGYGLFLGEEDEREGEEGESGGIVASALEFGKGRADWGPLTVYCLMRNGDLYARCPYLPKNSCVSPSVSHLMLSS